MFVYFQKKSDHLLDESLVFNSLSEEEQEEWFDRRVWSDMKNLYQLTFSNIISSQQNETIILDVGPIKSTSANQFIEFLGQAEPEKIHSLKRKLNT